MDLITQHYINHIYICNLVVVDVHNRAAINLPPMENIINGTDNRNSAKHHNSIVHIRNRWVVEEREEADDGLEDAVEEGDGVDRDALKPSANEIRTTVQVDTTYCFPQRERRRRQGLSKQSSPEYASNGNRVGHTAASAQKANDAVESRYTSQVKHRQNDRNEERDDDSVKRDGSSDGGNLPQPARERQAVVTREGPSLAGSSSKDGEVTADAESADNGDHGDGAAGAARCSCKYIHVWESRGRQDDLVQNVCDAEAECNDHDEAEDAVQEDSSNHHAWNDL